MDKVEERLAAEYFEGDTYGVPVDPRTLNVKDRRDFAQIPFPEQLQGFLSLRERANDPENTRKDRGDASLAIGDCFRASRAIRDWAFAQKIIVPPDFIEKLNAKPPDRRDFAQIPFDEQWQGYKSLVARSNDRRNNKADKKLAYGAALDCCRSSSEVMERVLSSNRLRLSRALGKRLTPKPSDK